MDLRVGAVLWQCSTKGQIMKYNFENYKKLHKKKKICYIVFIKKKIGLYIKELDFLYRKTLLR